MKIQFKDSSYIDCKQEDNKIIFIISSKDGNNPLKKITNIVELTKEQYIQLTSDIKIIS